MVDAATQTAVPNDIEKKTMQEISTPDEEIALPVPAVVNSSSSRKPAPSGMPPVWQSRYGIVLADASEKQLTQSLGAYGEWVEQELDLVGVLLEESQVALEYGAELGAHTLWLSKMVGAHGTVYAVEPDRMEHIALCATLALNQVRNVHPIHASLGDSASDVLTEAREGHPAEAIRQIKLDSLRLGELHLLKINPRGALLPVLAGGDAVLSNQMPAIYFRLSSAELAIKEIAALKARGYRCWSHLPYLHNADNFLGSKTNIFPGSVSQNVIAVHKSKSADFGHLPEL
jgi:FkbM family methyltransferase